MGWSSGGDLIYKVWGDIRDYIPDERKVQVVKQIMLDFMDFDWDDESYFCNKYPEAKIAFSELYPE